MYNSAIINSRDVTSDRARNFARRNAARFTSRVRVDNFLSALFSWVCALVKIAEENEDLNFTMCACFLERVVGDFYWDGERPNFAWLNEILGGVAGIVEAKDWRRR